MRNQLIEVTRHPDDVVAEAARVMNVCNACRYCEGICATFQAMTACRTFDIERLDYLANLCHNCSACLYDCQYAPPHEFDINVPVALAETRIDSYRRHVWPGWMGGVFQYNGFALAWVTGLVLSLALLLGHLLVAGEALFARHLGEGAFYQIISHQVMVIVAGSCFALSVLACGMSVRSFVRSLRYDQASGSAPVSVAFAETTLDVATLRNLGGGHGEGCHHVDDRPSNARRLLHHLTFYGFGLCLASTTVATFYHYWLGLQAPYALSSLPVLLGMAGGLGCIAGPVGLMWLGYRAKHETNTRRHRQMDVAFSVLLVLVSLTGLVLLGLRETPWMGIALLVHLGFVLAFFVLLPYSKFVHGLYRAAALWHFARHERAADQARSSS